jgi:hypothetical protein
MVGFEVIVKASPLNHEDSWGIYEARKKSIIGWG